jgi:hypothetical protein
LHLAERAVRDRYPITSDVRAFLVAEATRLATTSLSERVRVAALRVLIAADMANQRRERNRVPEQANEARQGADCCRELLRTRKGRELLLELGQLLHPPVSGQLPGPAAFHRDQSK